VPARSRESAAFSRRIWRASAIFGFGHDGAIAACCPTQAGTARGGRDRASSPGHLPVAYSAMRSQPDVPSRIPLTIWWGRWNTSDQALFASVTEPKRLGSYCARCMRTRRGRNAGGSEVGAHAFCFALASSVGEMGGDRF
jgi:hypothetical protein